MRLSGRDVFLAGADIFLGAALRIAAFFTAPFLATPFFAADRVTVLFFAAPRFGALLFVAAFFTAPFFAVIFRAGPRFVAALFAGRSATPFLAAAFLVTRLVAFFAAFLAVPEAVRFTASFLTAFLAVLFDADFVVMLLLRDALFFAMVVVVWLEHPGAPFQHSIEDHGRNMRCSQVVHRDLREVSRGFIKEDDQEEAPFIPPRAPLPDGVPNHVTPRGLELLHAERAALEAEKELPAANDDDRRRTLQVINGKLDLLNERIVTAHVVEPDPHAQEVRFGSTVTFRMLDGPQAGTVRTFTIVGVDEASVKALRIAFTAPIARALIGTPPGGETEFRLGTTLQRLLVLAIA